ncbi:hypothetical protein KI387_029128 [Taxus chinensis]|uniref:Uncharacterized protein n=1 Tax=Taxus chinensis TaxID=29808 RepID=A0AA38FDV2_TAXCH|nr:hypothetical protein KI387_029128 [Taxus chinensis]
MGCFNSRPAPDPIETPATFSSDPDISRSWAFFRIIEHNANQIFCAYNLHAQKSLRFPDFSEGLLNSATALLNGNLYVIGPTDFDGMASKNVYMCDPMAAFTWSQLPSTQTPRQNAVAVAANGKIYVFGGCRHRHQVNVPWGDVYDLSTSRRQWTAIRNPPQPFSSCLSRHSLQAVAFRDRIFLRNDFRGIAFNVISSKWETLPAVIANYWFKRSSAVEVSGTFVTYCQEIIGIASLRAFHPGRIIWLPLDLDPAVPAEMVQLLSVNGRFVAYNAKTTTSITNAGASLLDCRVRGQHMLAQQPSDGDITRGSGVGPHGSDAFYCTRSRPPDYASRVMA